MKLHARSRRSLVAGTAVAAVTGPSVAADGGWSAGAVAAGLFPFAVVLVLVAVAEASQRAADARALRYG